ncbi:NUDIX hydrolase [Indiicoccus explosivorum]|uniref:NUDIX hydrolase n=1 Tax=Indiicoccus explosivorum TaxID=1917864 RepID=UPI000B444F00|nr:NUDIX hydrolase [Indiicoccus explosivorum]
MDAVFKMEHAVFNYRVVGIWIHNGHILVHRDVNDQEQWSLPGGRVQIGEDSAASLVREFQEELGTDIRASRLLFSTENFFTFDGKKFHEIGFYYEVENDDTSLFGGEPFHGPEGERLIYQWVPVHELADFPLKPDFLREALQLPADQPRHVVVRDS